MIYFPNVKKVEFEGPTSKNVFAFKHYNPTEMVGNKTMKEHLRFAVCYWHTFTAKGSDPFGADTMIRPWDTSDKMESARKRAEAAFEFFDKIQTSFFCFHDADVAPEGNTLQETNKNLDTITNMFKDYMKTSDVKLLWNTANAFSHPRFVHGAATSNNADVFAYTASRVKKGLEIAKELGAQNYVFWGGREGYESIHNTNLKLEMDNLARFYHMAVDYAKEIGFDGQFLIEPKPMEPTKHQYDFDSATAVAFLKTYDLDKYFKLNIEANHATLAGHTFEHELRYARTNNMLGSLDANQGDMLLGWDTDEFPTDLYSATFAMYEILENGGIGKGGVNFDAKVRRSSFELDDLFLGHIAGMDTFARALKSAYKMKESRLFDDIQDKRYKSFTEGIGLDIVNGKTTLASLEAYAMENKEIKNCSDRLETMKSSINDFIF